MAKKKKASKSKVIPAFPPDIFWISPAGDPRDIIGHLTSIRAYPEEYGLPAAPVSREEEWEAFNYLFEEGWVRGRFTDGRFYFEMQRPRGTPMGNAYELALKFKDQVREVEVDFWDPRFKPMGKSMSGKEFLDQKFPARWGLGRSDGFEVRWEE